MFQKKPIGKLLWVFFFFLENVMDVLLVLMLMYALIAR
jgi:hypothetical protein